MLVLAVKIEERLESLEKKRNGARNNVYFFLALTRNSRYFSHFSRDRLQAMFPTILKREWATIRLNSG